MNALDDNRNTPSFALALGVSAGLVAAMAWMRLLLFPELAIPLSDALILLTALWHRDRRLLWGTFAGLVTVFWLKVWLFLPHDLLTGQHRWLFLGTQFLNAIVAAVVIDIVVRNGRRLDSFIGNLRASNDELRARDEQISRQNEELQCQTEELEQQAEELAAQSEEVQALNEELNRREASLQILLDASNPDHSEEEVLRRLCDSVLHLLGEPACASAVLERKDGLLRVRSWSGFGQAGPDQEALASGSTLADLVIQRGQSGAIADLALRPDIGVPQPGDGRVFRSVLAAPMRLGNEFVGTLEVYGTEPQAWRKDHYRLAEGIAEQCARVWEGARIREERARFAAEVERQRDFLGSLVENIPMAVGVVDGPEYRYVMANPAFRAIPGRPDEPVIGRTLDQVFPQAAQGMRAFFDEVRRTGKPARMHEHMANAGRGRETSWWSGEVLRQADGSLLILTMEVTEQVLARRRLEENESRYRALAETLELRVAERTAELGFRATQLQTLAAELTEAEQRERTRLAKMLHDHLQQLLVAAKLRIGLLPRLTVDPDLHTAAREVEGLLAESIQAVRTLTADLSPLVLHDRGLVPALEWLARWMREKHRFEIDLDLDEAAEPAAEAVRILLFESVRELLLNAVKHSGVDRARVSLLRDERDQVRLVVEDHGAGFDLASLRADERLAGGYGLFSIRERLDHLGGRMSVESAPGQGAHITLVAPVRLRANAPVPGGAMETATTASPAEARQGPGIRLLIADDHKILRQGLVSLLALEPDILIVGEASDGREAVRLAATLHPDVVIMDVTMPVMDGVEATRRITREQPGTRIIGLSLHETADMARSMKEAGAAAFLSKGGPADILVATIRDTAAGLPPGPSSHTPPIGGAFHGGF